MKLNWKHPLFISVMIMIGIICLLFYHVVFQGQTFGSPDTMNPKSAGIALTKVDEESGEFPLNIRWQSSLNKEIEINAYNILGQKVESIFSGNSNKSMNQIIWTPENLSSGVYIIEITDQVTSDHQKVILLK